MLKWVIKKAHRLFDYYINSENYCCIRNEQRKSKKNTNDAGAHNQFFFHFFALLFSAIRMHNFAFKILSCLFVYLFAVFLSLQFSEIKSACYQGWGSKYSKMVRDWNFIDVYFIYQLYFLRLSRVTVIDNSKNLKLLYNEQWAKVLNSFGFGNFPWTWITPLNPVQNALKKFVKETPVP